MDKGHTAVWIKGHPGEDEQGSAGKDANFLAGLQIRPDSKTWSDQVFKIWSDPI